MLKSICIKTNNKHIANYLLNELEYFNVENTYISCYDFKHYTNVIIHYTGTNVDLFLSKVSTLLSYIVIDLYEPNLIKHLLNLNYFYFSSDEKKQIYNICQTNFNFSNSIQMLNIISHSFFEYLTTNKYLILDGFVNFRLQDYIRELDSIVDLCVNKFIIDREYHDFINLLKSYINSNPSSCNVIHLIYKNQNSTLLDESKNIVKFNSELVNRKFLSDISFSSNDFALNSLLTLLPQKLYIHLIDVEDDFINTLKLIFDNRAYICNDCDLCNLYKSHSIKC